MRVNYERLPEAMRGGAQRYIESGIAPGDFMSAVICNDLKEAIGRADSTNLPRLLDIVSFWYNEAPSNCWGSREKFLAWCRVRCIPRAQLQGGL